MDIPLATKQGEATGVPPSRVMAAGATSNLNPNTVAVLEETSTEAIRTANRTINLTEVNKPVTAAPMKVRTGTLRAVTDNRATTMGAANKQATVDRMTITEAANKPAMAPSKAAMVDPMTIHMAAIKKVAMVSPTTVRTDALRPGTDNRETPTASRNRATVNPTTARTETPRAVMGDRTTRMEATREVMANPTTNRMKAPRVVTDGRTILMVTTGAAVVKLTADRTRAPKVAMDARRTDRMKILRAATDDLMTPPEATVAVMANRMTKTTVDLKTRTGAAPPVRAGRMITLTEEARKVMANLITPTLVLTAERRSLLADMAVLEEVMVPSGTMMTGLVKPPAIARGTNHRISHRISQLISHRKVLMPPVTPTLLAIPTLPEVTMTMARKVTKSTMMTTAGPMARSD